MTARQAPARRGEWGIPAALIALCAVPLIAGAVVAIRRRDLARHRAWMLRAYAIGLGAGTQVLTLLLGELVLAPRARSRGAS